MDLTYQVIYFLKMNEITANVEKQQRPTDAKQFWQKIETVA